MLAGRARPACPSLDAAAHNFSSFHFQEAIRPVPKSSDRALCHEHTSSLVRSSARKKNLDQLKTTVLERGRTVCWWVKAKLLEFG